MVIDDVDEDDDELTPIDEDVDEQSESELDRERTINAN